ncbi:MAG: hypothetical protein KAU31_11895 [Spirochaetaceae bacterium]|nr:hypothetical protein [Spirochaetaceae bacterium]
MIDALDLDGVSVNQALYFLGWRWGAPSEVVEATESLVRNLTSRGGPVLSSGNTITSSVKPENFRAMIEAGQSVVFGVED